MSFSLRVIALAGTLVLAWLAPAGAHVGATGRVPQSVEVPRPLALPAQAPVEAPIVATPRATCDAKSRPEPSIQGRLPREEVDSGRAGEGYWCNLSVVGHSGNTGGFRVHRYVDEAGHECAYYDTALLFPTNALNLGGEPTGVAVLDMSDPSKPVRTETLFTPAMQTPHESLNISVQRGILAAVMGNPAQYPGGIDVFDISEDCRHPAVKAAAFPATPFGHESGMAPDGLTFYPTSPGSSDMSAVDISNPSLPRTITTTNINTHGMSVSDDGRRGYLATLDGLVIVDLSEVQERKPDARVREISRLVWSNMTIPQVAIPVTIGGKPYLVEVDEYSKDAGGGSVAANGERVGAARIIDISDETRPRVVSNIRLAVHQPENREVIADDYGAQSPVQGYAGHYCNVPQRDEPGIFACSMIASGLRVFDIRDPEQPKEIAYFMSPPSTISATGGPVIDERSNWAMSQPAFAPERGEIWYSDGNSGFYALKMDPAVWPFATTAAARGCVDHRGLASVSVKRVRGGLRLGFRRRVQLPVRIDVFRVSKGRRVIAERRVASFPGRRSSPTWHARAGRGYYFARFSMLKNGRAFDIRRVVLRRTGEGFLRRPLHARRDSCSLIRRFKLQRPVFGGRGKVGLRGAYRVNKRSSVSIVVTRGKKIVKRFAPATRGSGRTHRFALPARGLRRGDYRVHLRIQRGEEQAAATLTARRL